MKRAAPSGAMLTAAAGFLVSLLLGAIAFPALPVLPRAAKRACLTAAASPAGAGLAVLRVARPRRRRTDAHALVGVGHPSLVGFDAGPARLCGLFVLGRIVSPDLAPPDHPPTAS